MFYSSRAAHWARRHTFTLDTPGWVTVSVDSARPAGAEALDTYVVLIEDGNNKSTVVRRDDNSGTRTNGRRTNARLADVFLQPGTYTVEATTKTPQTAGSYNLDIQAVVTGLKARYTATVNAPRTITFHYWPRDAQIAVKAAAAEEFGLTVTAADGGDGYGTATIALTPRLVGDHDVAVRISSRTLAGRLLSFRLAAGCPAGPPVPNGPSLTTSPHNSVLCIKTGASDPAPGVSSGPWGTDYHYEVTPGALNGILESAHAAVAARPDVATCGLTPTKLASYLLSIGHHEIRKTQANAQGKQIFQPRTPARSASALSRADTSSSRMYSDGVRSSAPKRAFFHPGVGWWQIDDAGSWPYLNHGQRSNTGLGPEDDKVASGGEAIAAHLAGLFCAGDGRRVKDEAIKHLFQGNTWYGCKTGGCHANSGFIHLDNSDDLYVTISKENSGDYSASGGVTTHRCRWNIARTAAPFPCFFHDPTVGGHEGWLSDWAPKNTAGNPSPLAAPFISFAEGPEAGKRRFAVFPGRMLEMFESGTFPTRYKSVLAGKNVRYKEAQGVWSSASYNRGTTAAPRLAVLEIEVCEEAEWVASDGRRCGWHSVEDDDIADTLGVDSP